VRHGGHAVARLWLIACLAQLANVEHAVRVLIIRLKELVDALVQPRRRLWILAACVHRHTGVA
jgi:hypothetical protein